MNNPTTETITITTAGALLEGQSLKTSTGDFRPVVAVWPQVHQGTDPTWVFPEVIVWLDCGRGKPEAVRLSAQLTVEVID